MSIQPKTISYTLIALFCLLVVGQVATLSLSPALLNAACAVWTNGNDSVTCTGTVTSIQDFLLGSDSLTNEGTLYTDFGEGAFISYADLDGSTDIYTFISTNSGNSNDSTAETIINNGRIDADIPSSVLTDSGEAGLVIGTVLFFDNRGGASTLENNGIFTATFDGVSLADVYLVYKKEPSILNVTNTGTIDIAHDNSRILYTSGNLVFTNTGRVGTTTYNQAHTVFVNASSTITNTSSGIWYAGVNGSAEQDTFINRGTFSVPVGPYFNLNSGNDVFLHNLSLGSYSGRIIGGGGDDTFVLEVNSAAHASFDRSDFDLQNFKYFETRGTGTINIDTTYTLGAAYDDTSFVKLSVFEGTLSASSSVQIDGDFTVDATGGLYITLDSDTPTTTSRFTVTGTATIGGSLTVTDDGSSLSSGQSYTLLDAATLSGTFDTTTLPTLGSGLAWNTSYENNKVTLSITSTGSSGGGSGGGRSGASTEELLDQNRKTYTTTEETTTDEEQSEIIDKTQNTNTEDTNPQALAPQRDGIQPLVKPVLNICPIFNTYLFPNQQNDKGAVLRWQAFLTDQIGIDVSWSGIYDTQTVEGTKVFQKTYAPYVLQPWGLSEPTGNVYKTTRAFANWLLGCKEPATQLESSGTYELLFLDIWSNIS